MALTDRQAVRILIFDPDTGDEAGFGNPENKGFTGSANFSDDEIDYFLSLYDGATAPELHFRAAAVGCRAMAAKNVRRSVTASDGGTFTHDSRQITLNWRQLAKDYEAQADDVPVLLIAETSATIFSHADLLRKWSIDRLFV